MKRILIILLAISLVSALGCSNSAGSSMQLWVGNYTFSEFVPPDQNMFYGISIIKEDDGYYTEISIDGFQTVGRLKAKVEGDRNSINLIFNEYLPDNMSEPYKVGEVLLSFERKNSELITFWGKIRPIDQINTKSESVCFKVEP